MDQKSNDEKREDTVFQSGLKKASDELAQEDLLVTCMGLALVGLVQSIKQFTPPWTPWLQSNWWTLAPLMILALAGPCYDSYVMKRPLGYLSTFTVFSAMTIMVEYVDALWIFAQAFTSQLGAVLIRRLYASQSRFGFRTWTWIIFASSSLMIWVALVTSLFPSYFSSSSMETRWVTAVAIAVGTGAPIFFPWGKPEDYEDGASNEAVKSGNDVEAGKRSTRRKLYIYSSVLPNAMAWVLLSTLGLVGYFFGSSIPDYNIWASRIMGCFALFHTLWTAVMVSARFRPRDP